METRTIKQLLQLTLKYFKKWDIKGICAVLQVMNDRGIITREEFEEINDFIKDNRPTEGKFFDKSYFDCDNIYFFDPEDRNIRIEWLNFLINEIDNGEN